MSSVVNTNAALDKNSFLQLMVSEMKNQDPLQPQDSNQFLNQLAQFTTMEQMMNIEQTDTQMQQVNQLAFEHSLIGQTVSVADENGNQVTGQVTGIQLNNGDPQLVIQGTAYSLTSLTSMGDITKPDSTGGTP
jgi:flagellar basal-body rod modification protein FlgD